MTRPIYEARDAKQRDGYRGKALNAPATITLMFLPPFAPALTP